MYNIWSIFSEQHNSMTKLCHALLKYENEIEIGWDNWLTTM